MAHEIDNNGFTEFKDNALTKVGVFPYLGKDIPGAPDPSGIYYVYRPEEELAHPDCIKSFKLLPWIDEHTMLGDVLPNAVPVEQRPVSGVIGEDVYFKDGALRGNLKLFSGALGTRIKSNEKRELSLGYSYRLDPTAGVFGGQPYQYIQRQIRGNHLASVKEGRSGPDVCVSDHMDIFVSTYDNLELETMADETVKPDDKEGEVEATGSMTLDQLIELVNKIAPQVQALTEAMEALKKPATEEVEATVIDNDNVDDEGKKAAGLDAKIARLESTISTLQKNQTTSVKQVLASVAQRDLLAKQLSSHVGAFDHADLTLEEVAAYGVKKLALACDSGQELAYLRGFLARPSSTVATATDAAVDKNARSIVGGYINGEKK